MIDLKSPKTNFWTLPHFIINSLRLKQSGWRDISIILEFFFLTYEFRFLSQTSNDDDPNMDNA